MNPTFGLPSPTLPIGDPKTGIIASIWYQFFVRLSQLSAERPIAPITVGTSPFVYAASTIGHVFISGGMTPTIVLERSGVPLTCPENVFIPVAANDTITITHAGAPTMTFVPSARA
jgi:hypothetical protein